MLRQAGRPVGHLHGDLAESLQILSTVLENHPEAREWTQFSFTICYQGPKESADTGRRGRDCLLVPWLASSLILPWF